MPGKNLLCALGMHRYDHCICIRCFDLRNEDHFWEGCKCKYCGRTRNEAHRWNGCRCEVCGMTRDEEHQWDDCRCAVCGKAREEEYEGHDWDGCKCCKCGRTRSEGHIFDADAVRMKMNPTFNDAALNPKTDQTLKCTRCQTDVFFEGGRYYCPKCFHEIDSTLQYTDSPTLMKRVFTCKNCGYQGAYEFSDSY